jgi:hypothetical protein
MYLCRYPVWVAVLNRGLSAFKAVRRRMVTRARIFKLLRSPGIDYKESIPPAYVAWRACTKTLFLFGPSPHRFFKNSSTVLSMMNYLGEKYYVSHRTATSELGNKMMAQKDKRRVEVLFIPFRSYKH